jgi:hypothetical protein
MIGTLDAFLCFCAGIFFHMSVLHFFCFAQTASHPMIRMWKRPKLASSIWGSIQLVAGALILLLLNYRFRLDLDTLTLLAGFCFWGILVAVVSVHDPGSGAPPPWGGIFQSERRPAPPAMPPG